MPKQNTKKYLKRKMKKGNKTNRKKGGASFMEMIGFKKKDANGNVIQEPPKPTEKSDWFGFLNKSDPAEAIAKLEKEKDKCISDIDAKIATIKTKESTNPTSSTKEETQTSTVNTVQEPVTQQEAPVENQLSVAQPVAQPVAQQKQNPFTGGILQKPKRRRTRRNAF